MVKINIDWKKLRKGEKVDCPQCKEGQLITPYNPETSHFFVCSSCGLKINCD